MLQKSWKPESVGFFKTFCVFVCQIHLKNRELENTKLSTELQMLKSVDVNKENTIAQFKEEVGRLQACLTEKDKQYREILAKVSPMVEIFHLLCSLKLMAHD